MTVFDKFDKLDNRAEELHSVITLNGGIADGIEADKAMCLVSDARSLYSEAMDTECSEYCWNLMHSAVDMLDDAVTMLEAIESGVIV